MSFEDTDTGGIPNLVSFAPGLWRMGQPANENAWRTLATIVAPKGEPVAVIKLNDEAEGSDDTATQLFGWVVLRMPIPPYDDKAWTVFSKPDPAVVDKIVTSILEHRRVGQVVVWHCSHGRDRTGLISALVGMKLFGWSKSYAWDNMLAHGFRWELPDLDAYWAENVPDTPSSAPPPKPDDPKGEAP